MHVCARVCVGTCVHVPMHMHDKLRGRFIDSQGSPVSAPSAGLQIQVNMPSLGTHARDQDSGLVQHPFSLTPSIRKHSVYSLGRGKHPFPLPLNPAIPPLLLSPVRRQSLCEWPEFSFCHLRTCIFIHIFSFPLSTGSLPAFKYTPGSLDSNRISLHSHNHKYCLYSPPWPCPVYLLPSIVVKTLE